MADKPLEPLTWSGVDTAPGLDFTLYMKAKIVDAFRIPPRILYSKFRPYLVVDNTRDD